MTTLEALRYVLDPSHHGRLDYLDTCRRRRNQVDYDLAGITSGTEAAELVAQALEFRDIVEEWVRNHHPQLSR